MWNKAAAKAEAKKPKQTRPASKTAQRQKKAFHPGAAQSRQEEQAKSHRSGEKSKNWRCEAVNKFENVDVLAALEQLMRQNTAFTAMILRLTKMIRQAAASDRAEDKTLLWMSRPSGTYCFRARRFPAKIPGSIIHGAFTGSRPVTVFWPTPWADRQRWAEKIRGKISMSWTIPSISGTSQPRQFKPIPSSCTMKRATGSSLPSCTLTATQTLSWGCSCGMRQKPNEPENPGEVLRQEQKGREQLQPGDFKAHVTALHDRLIRDEAQRIVTGLKELSTPNSPNKTHFMVELSPYFTQIASSKDTDRLFFHAAL